MISVVVTCYNYGRYVARCVSSVLAQTCGDLELVIVNDGSTDDTDLVLRPFLSTPNLRYIRQANAGQANAKNTGIRNSTGEYVAFLDADDYWEPDKLEKQAPLFRNPKVGIVYSRARYVTGEGKDFAFRGKYRWNTCKRGTVTNDLIFDNFVPFSSSVVRRACLDEGGAFDESLKMAIDWDLWLRLSVRYEFDFVDEPLLVYRIGHEGQMSRNAETRVDCTERIMTRFLERHPEAVPPGVLREARTYACMIRGDVYKDTNRAKSNGFYRMALRYSPFHLPAYRGLIRNLVR